MSTGLNWFKERVVETTGVIGKDIRKLRRDALRARMEAQNLKFEFGATVGERPSKNNERHNVKLLKVTLSDISIMQEPPLVTNVELLIDRYKQGDKINNSNQDVRLSGYKHEWQPSNNGRVNRIKLNPPQSTVVDFKQEFYFDKDLRPTGVGHRHTAYNGTGGYIYLGFRLAYTIRGKKYETGILGTMQMLGHKVTEEYGYITYIYQR